MTPELHDSINREVNALDGWPPNDRVLSMSELVIEHDIQTAVSLGVFGGRSVMAIALAMKSKGSGIVYGLDPWKVEDAIEAENEANRAWWAKNVDLHEIHRKAMEALWRNGLDDYAIIIRAASQRLPRLFGGGIGLLEIDGNHSEVASCRDVKLYMPQVQSGGWVVCDDCDWPTTHKAQAMVLEECDLVKEGSAGHWKIFRRR